MEISGAERLKFNISAGIYILNPEVIDYIPYNEHFGMPMLIKSCIEKNRKVFSYDIKEYWLGLEKLTDFNQASLQEYKWKD